MLVQNLPKLARLTKVFTDALGNSERPDQHKHACRINSTRLLFRYIAVMWFSLTMQPAIPCIFFLCVLAFEPRLPTSVVKTKKNPSSIIVTQL